MNIFEFSTERFCSEEDIFLELNKYFDTLIHFINREKIWDLLDNNKIEKNIVGIDFINDKKGNYKTYINAVSNFDDVSMMQGFYKHLSEVLQTAVAFNGFTNDTCQMLYLYSNNQKLYEARIESDEQGDDIVVPTKKIRRVG